MRDAQIECEAPHWPKDFSKDRPVNGLSPAAEAVMACDTGMMVAVALGCRREEVKCVKDKSRKTIIVEQR